MEEILIEKVREHEVIYNTRLADYRDQHIRQTAWEEIAAELNISANKVKECWEKLRRCFCNARNRRREEGKSGTSYKKKTVWKYEKQMEFLLPFIENRKTYSNLNEVQPSSITTVGEGNLPETSDAEESTLQETQEEVLNDLDEEHIQGVHRSVASDKPVTVLGARDEEKKNYEALKTFQNKKREKSKESPALQMVQILKESSAVRKRKYETLSHASKSNSLLETLDEMDMYFLSMSRMTKKLPKIDQAQIKLALSNSVLSAEIKNQQVSMPSHSHHSYHGVQQQSYSAPPTPNSSNIHFMTSPSNCSTEDIENYSTSSITTERPTLLQLVDLPSQQFQ